MEVELSKRRFTNNEDLANAISHFVGAILSLAGLVLMVAVSFSKGNVWQIVSSAVFGLSMVFLYTSSTVAHSLREGKLKDTFFTLDQIAIFVLIAGTYTPLSLVALHGKPGWIIFCVEWGLASIGIIRLLLRNNELKSVVGVIDILIYIGMGWLVVLVSGAVLKTVPAIGFIWIIIGGLFYTSGVIFFKIAKFHFHHLVWHLMVIAGTLSHFIAIFFYILK